MVNALVSGENDKAKEHLSDYFGDTATRLINPPESLEPAPVETPVPPAK